MNGTLLKALVALVAVSLLFCRSAVSFFAAQEDKKSLVQWFEILPRWWAGLPCDSSDNHPWSASKTG